MIEVLMYKKTTPQKKLFDVGTQLSPRLRNRLESSWAHLFKNEVLPILFRDEDRYAMLYGKTGRPNFTDLPPFWVVKLKYNFTPKTQRA